MRSAARRGGPGAERGPHCQVPRPASKGSSVDSARDPTGSASTRAAARRWRTSSSASLETRRSAGGGVNQSSRVPRRGYLRTGQELTGSDAKELKQLLKGQTLCRNQSASTRVEVSAQARWAPCCGRTLMDGSGAPSPYRSRRSSSKWPVSPAASRRHRLGVLPRRASRSSPSRPMVSRNRSRHDQDMPRRASRRRVLGLGARSDVRLEEQER